MPPGVMGELIPVEVTARVVLVTAVLVALLGLVLVVPEDALLDGVVVCGVGF